MTRIVDNDTFFNTAEEAIEVSQYRTIITRCKGTTENEKRLKLLASGWLETEKEMEYWMEDFWRVHIPRDGC